jgi:DNA oxidative demethylase
VEQTALPFAEAEVVPGLGFERDVFSETEERELVAGLEQIDLPHFAFQQWTSRRRTLSFGYAYDFRDLNFAPADPIPEFLLPVRDRAAAFVGVPAENLVQLSVIRYDPGAGIGWHIDRPELGTVIGISLGTPATMRFRRKMGDGYKRATKLLPPRSIYHLAGEVRYEWEHSIPPGQGLRWSITCRGLSQRGAERVAKID